MARNPDESPQGAGVRKIIGVGLDCGDEHKRITKARNFLLVGGSGETHARMQEGAMKFNEELSRKGKELPQLEVDELHDIARRSGLVSD